MRIVPLLALLLLLAGCASVGLVDVSGAEWQRAGAGIQQVTYDEVECARATFPAGDFPETVIGGVADAVAIPLAGARRRAAWGHCMRDKGYGHIARQD